MSDCKNKILNKYRNKQQNRYIYILLTLQKLTLPWRNQLIRVVHGMELLQTSGVSLKLIYWIFQIRYLVYFTQLIVLNRAVDGRVTTNFKPDSCSHTAQSKTPWLVIDLQGNYPIHYIRILNRGDCCSK